MPSHRNGPLKQQNKKHKAEKKKTQTAISKNTKKSTKISSKRERRLMSKQKRLILAKTLKNLVSAQGDEYNPIWCTLIPLTSSVPVNLAKLLFQKCEPFTSVTEENNLVGVSKIYFPSLNKHVSFLSADPDDLFGTMDLALLSDWIVLLIPSNFVELDATSEAFLSCLYAQGLSSAVFAVMSPDGNLKEIKRSLESRFPVPENNIYPLNTGAHAINLLRHITSTHKSVGAFRNGADPSNLHSATRFRAKMLANHVGACDEQGTPIVLTTDDQSSTVYLSVEGPLRGAPLFLCDQLEQKSLGSCGPLLHLSGWGDFPISSATWQGSKGMKSNWTAPKNILSANGASSNYLRTNELADVSDDEMDDSDCSNPFGSAEPSSEDEESNSEECVIDDLTQQPAKEMDVDHDEESDGDSYSAYAARTLASSVGTTYSAAQLARFRNARMEEMFPDEVETPPSIPARTRFSKYRSLPRFQGSVWPTDNDQFPSHFENIACFKNYHRNRRSILRYLTTRIRRSVKPNFTATESFIPPNPVTHFILGPMDRTVVNMILQKHTVSLTGSGEAGTKHVPSPLCLWSLLPHEGRVSVCHFTMHRVTSAIRAASDLVAVATAANKVADRATSTNLDHMELGEEAASRLEMEEDEIRQALLKHQKRRGHGSEENPMLPPEAEPIRSKDLMLYQVGIRRFVAAPIYSTQTTNHTEKAKFEQFFPANDTTIVATVYAPVMYAPANVLQFRVRVDEDDDGNIGSPYVGELVATGNLHSVDPMRLIIKRIFLSGHPYKISQRNAVVRFMFFNPTDVEYFKPVALQTKTGAVGHIKEPVGTHGYMKCVFDRPLQASDVVLMPLYKRVFPKWVYQPIIRKVLEMQTAVNKQTLRSNDWTWQETADTLQLSRPERLRKEDENLLKTMSVFA